jgi:2-desacetyl-2-hydroxyethyl bacteriochlorophyllide A dehydrogenase
MQAIWLEEQTLNIREDVPLPTPSEGEALIKILLAGVCSTDLELVRGYYPFSGIPGHEFVGRVVSSPGDPSWIEKRVVGEINIACGKCDTCKSGLNRHCERRKTLGIYDWNGAFAEYLVLPLANLHVVPIHVPNEVAVFTEPLAAAHEILEQTSLSTSDRVLVIGAGRLGQLIASVIHGVGCHLDVIARHPRQRELLTRGNINIIHEDDINTRSYDVVVEATGTAGGFELAMKLIHPRGRVILKSTYKGNVEVNFSKIVVDEITLIGSRCGSFEPALRLMSRGEIDPRQLIDATYSLDQGMTAFEHASRPGVLKVLVQPGEA